MTTSKDQQLKQNTFIHLNVSQNGKTVFSKVLQAAKQRENQQTNMKLSVGELDMIQTTPLLTARQGCQPPALDPDPPQALLVEQRPRCVSLLWGELQQRLRPFQQAEVSRRIWGLGVWQGAE